MKRIYTILLAVFLTSSLFAQAPEKMSYQAVIRNTSDQLVTNQGIGMQISILQGTVTGTAVYVETHNTTTNANGLVSLEIGTGAVVSGNFATIDWANGIYFIKTETDPTTAGGTSYTITGTSQLLSVPYALHAKTADHIAGGITETDPVYASSQASNITATDVTNLSNLSGTNTGDQIISRTGLTVTLTNGGSYRDSINTYTAGSGIDIINNIISKTKYQVGDFAQGGVVFYVDETGEHGLVCAKTNQNGGNGVRWYAGTYGNTQAKGDGTYAGEGNTSIIIASQVAIGDDGNTYAARICNELIITENGITYGDWYLPSKEELALMANNRYIIDATATANGGTSFFCPHGLWSSTEDTNNNAWRNGFNGGGIYSTPKDFQAEIRAIRAF